jgi:hypothetical protein
VLASSGASAPIKCAAARAERSHLGFWVVLTIIVIDWGAITERVQGRPGTKQGRGLDPAGDFRVRFRIVALGADNQD